jgi:hypothetical protein
MPSKIRLFKPGRHTDSNGVVRDYTEQELQGCAVAYDPAVYRAPLVVGHPKMDDPAFGWIASLAIENGELVGVPEEVNPEFAEAVNSGAYSRVSIRLWLPNSQGNPHPGALSLRHVGFLGAAAPAIKGLGVVKFADADEDTVTVEFGESGELPVIASLFRQLRDFFLAEKGLEAADGALPSWLVGQLEAAAAAPTPPPASTPAATLAYSEPPSAPPNEPQEAPPVTVTPEQLAAQEADLKRRQEALDAREKAAAHADNVAFAEGLAKEGRLLPADKEAVVAFMDGLPQDSTVEFGEGDKKTATPTRDWLKGFLARQPKHVEFSEAAPGTGDDLTSSPSFAAPPGSVADTERLELHGKALQYQATHKCDYIAAYKAVGGR